MRGTRHHPGPGFVGLLRGRTYKSPEDSMLRTRSGGVLVPLIIEKKKKWAGVSSLYKKLNFSCVLISSRQLEAWAQPCENLVVGSVI